MRLTVDEPPIEWAGQEYKKAHPEKTKRETVRCGGGTPVAVGRKILTGLLPQVASFDVDASTVALIRKGKAEMLRPLSDVLSLTLDPDHSHIATCAFDCTLLLLMSRCPLS